MCSQCNKGRKGCKYVDQDKPKFEFVNQHQKTLQTHEEEHASVSGTWDSVIDNQVDLVKKAGDGKNDVPVWAVAEAQEVISSLT